MLFMKHLIAQLDLETPGWQANTIILADNAPYHRGVDIRSHLRKMQVPFSFSAPYSYSASAIETLFAHLKLGEINKRSEPTGKR